MYATHRLNVPAFFHWIVSLFAVKAVPRKSRHRANDIALTATRTGNPPGA